MYIKGTRNTVIIPATPIQILLIAPSVSPSSKALAVPKAWEEVPKATPFDRLSSILKILNMKGPIIDPSIPVTIIENTVREGIPPRVFDISTPIGTVTDLGAKDLIISKSKFTTFDRIIMENIPTMLPTNIPHNKGNRLDFNKSNLLYKGTAKTTVAGPRKKEIKCPPKLYCSKLTLKIVKIKIIISTLISNGFNKGNLNLLYKIVLISKHTRDIKIPNKGELITSVNFCTSLFLFIYK